MEKYKFTDKCGCAFSDRIAIDMSPTDLERFYQIMKDKAIRSQDYSEQAEYHRVTDLLKKHFDDYKKARKKHDQKPSFRMDNCPFCGSGNLRLCPDGDEGVADWFVECQGCFGSGALCKTRDTAINAWNQRHVFTQAQE